MQISNSRCIWGHRYVISTRKIFKSSIWECSTISYSSFMSSLQTGFSALNGQGKHLSLSGAILRAAHGEAVRCPLPGKYPLMQAWRLLAGHIAQKERHRLLICRSFPIHFTHPDRLFSPVHYPADPSHCLPAQSVLSPERILCLR